MLMQRVVLSLWSLASVALSTATAHGQGTSTGPLQPYPNKPIRIVTTEPGSGTDFASRLIAQGLAAPLAQKVIVDNRGGVIPGELVARAPPDGYTLLLNGPAIWLAQFLKEKMPWDPLRDFSSITLAARSPNILVVHPSVPVRSVQELIALAKAKPAELNYGSGLAGNSPHLAAELFKAMAGVNIVRVAYKGAGLALNALIAAQIQVMFANAGSAAPHAKSGRLKALAVTSAQPFALFPDLPTVAASGLPGYESVAMFGIFVPAGTPAAVVNRLNREIVHVLNNADVREKFLNAGLETVGTSPERFTTLMKAEMASMGKVIKDAGIRDEE